VILVVGVVGETDDIGDALDTRINEDARAV
jgi:hypothetical protein